MFPSLAGCSVPCEGGTWAAPSCPCSVPTALPQEMLSTASLLMSTARVTLPGPSRQEKFPRKALGALRSEGNEWDAQEAFLFLLTVFIQKDLALHLCMTQQIGV